MANTSRKHNRQRRSTSGKTQAARTASNKARQAVRRKKRIEAAAKATKLEPFLVSQGTWAVRRGKEVITVGEAPLTANLRSRVIRLVSQVKGYPSASFLHRKTARRASMAR